MTEWLSAVSAIATVGATGVALWVVVHEGKSRNADLRVRDAERRDQEAAQARLITSEAKRLDRDAHINNHSAAPVFDVRVIRAEATSAEGGPVAPAFMPDARRTFPVLGAGKEARTGLSHTVWGHGDVGVVPHGSTHVRLTIQFLDASGLWWERTGAEQPRRLVDGPSAPEPGPE
jgi:hypothetical protein